MLLASAISVATPTCHEAGAAEMLRTEEDETLLDETGAALEID